MYYIYTYFRCEIVKQYMYKSLPKNKKIIERTIVSMYYLSLFVIIR